MDIQNLRSKLDDAIANYKDIEDKKISEKYKYHITITKMFNKMQANIIAKMERQDTNCMRLMYKDRIHKCFNRLRKHLSIKKENKTIDKQLKIFKMNIDVKENMLQARTNRQNQSLENEIDSTLYQYYSSSDDVSSNMTYKSTFSGDMSANTIEINKEIKEKLDDKRIKAEIETRKTFEEDMKRMKDEIRNEENDARVMLTTMHELREKIHNAFKRLALNKLKLTEELLNASKNEAQTMDQYNKQIEAVNTDLGNEKKEVQNVQSILQTERDMHKKDPEIYHYRSHIMQHFLNFEKCIMKSKEKIMDNTLSEIQFVLHQGCLDNDERFLAKLDKQIKDIEKFDTPRFFKIGVTMEIARKYVDDIIYLKKKALVKKYYNLN